MRYSSHSRSTFWSLAAVASIKDGLPVRWTKVVLLNKQVKLVHKTWLGLGDCLIIPLVMIQYEPDVTLCPRTVAPPEQHIGDIQEEVLIRGTHQCGVLAEKT